MPETGHSGMGCTQGSMHETVMTLRDGMGREVGGGFRMGDTCTPMADSCQCMAKPLQYCKVISLQLNTFFKKVNLKNK